MDKLVDLYQVSAIPMETLTARVNALNQERKVLREQLEIDAAPTEECSRRVRGMAEKFLNEFDASPLASKRLLIGMFVKSIQIDGTAVSIAWNV